MCFETESSLLAWGEEKEKKNKKDLLGLEAEKISGAKSMGQTIDTCLIQG